MIAAKCDQIATVCRVGDAVPLMPKYALFAKVGKSPHKNDGRRWVTYFYEKDKDGVRPTDQRPLSERCDYIAGARGNEADDPCNEGCECLRWHPDTKKDSHPMEDKGGYALWCGVCEKYHTEKDVKDVGTQSLHIDFRPSQHDWKSVKEFATDIRWIRHRIKNMRDSGGAYPLWDLAIQRPYV